MAVKKKSAAKKTAKKAPAKRVVKKTAKKSVAKKKIAKKAPAKRATKKAVAKKAPAKRAAKKAVAKKAPAKRAAKKAVAKKAPAKRAAKKSAANPVTQLVSVSTTPVPPKPTFPGFISAGAGAGAGAGVGAGAGAGVGAGAATPKQSTSGRVAFFVIAGIVILAAIVWSKSGKESDDAPAPTPSISQSAEPTESATAEPTESAVPVVAVEAPTKFVALNSTDGLKLRWVAPTAMDGLTGYNVEVRANGAGDWMTIATVPVDQLTQNVTKSSDSGWTQFRVSSVYSDGQIASSEVFGIPGEFK